MSKLKVIYFFTLLFLLFVGNTAISGTTAWLTTSTTKLFPDSEPPANALAAYEFTAVRNEFAPFQAAVRADADVSGVKISVGDLAGPGGAVIRASAAELLLVETVTITNPSMSSGRRAWPDPLPPYHPFDVNAGQTCAVWVDLFVSADAAPGDYAGTVTVAAGGAEQQLPVKLTVRDIQISTIPHLRTAFGIGYGSISEAHGVEKGSPEAIALGDKYYWILVNHRLSPYFIPVDLFSDEAHKYLDDPRVTFLRAPMSWDEAEMQRIADRLKDTGWIEKAHMYHVDEPDSGDYEKINKIGQWIHKFNPDIKMLLTYRYDPGLEPAGIQVWCPSLTYTMAPNEMQGLLEEKKRGKELWWYTCIGPKWPGTTYFIDEAATAPRLLTWMNNLYGVSGILYWNTTSWSRAHNNPWVNTETYPGGNGDGSLLYPGSIVGVDGPVVSQRMKMLREGMEDYELLFVLRTALEQAAQTVGGEAASEYDPAARLFEYAYALLTRAGRSNPLGPKTPYLNFVTTDYQEIEAARMRAMDEIFAAPQHPLVLVMSDPYDNGFASRDEARVWGYVEPGATVTINGEPAMTRGVQFRARVPLAPGENELRIVVSGNGAEKTVVRTVHRN